MNLHLTDPSRLGGSRFASRRTAFVLALFAAVAFVPLPASATSMLHRDVVELLELSEIVVAGTVVELTDGFDDAGTPFTEVTLSVQETLRGSAGHLYTFRQFGLLAPKETAQGLTSLAVSPDGWPRFQRGDEVLLFLYAAASRTGFRTTTGLLQGAFRKQEGRYVNGIGNRGLFAGVSIDEASLEPRERAMIHGGTGAAPADVFLPFLRRAIGQRWVESGVLRHE